MIMTSVADVKKHFYLSLMLRSNKLECFRYLIKISLTVYKWKLVHQSRILSINLILLYLLYLLLYFYCPYIILILSLYYPYIILILYLYYLYIILILSWYYPDIILILSWYYPDIILKLSLNYHYIIII